MERRIFHSKENGFEISLKHMISAKYDQRIFFPHKIEKTEFDYFYYSG